MNEAMITLADLAEWCDHADTRLSMECALEYMKAQGLDPEKYELIPVSNALAWRIVRKDATPSNMGRAVPRAVAHVPSRRQRP